MRRHKIRVIVMYRYFSTHALHDIGTTSSRTRPSNLYSYIQASMKLLQLSGFCALCFTSGNAFMVSPPPGVSRMARSAGDYVPIEGEGKINLKVRI